VILIIKRKNLFIAFENHVLFYINKLINKLNKGYISIPRF